MQRTLINVDFADTNGWSVALVGRLFADYPTKPEAIDAAQALASLRHSNTGEPTAVRIADETGQASLIASYG